MFCLPVELWNLRHTLESCNKTKRQQWIICFFENIYLYFQGRGLGYGEAVLLTASLLFSFCPAPRLILWFPSRFSSTVFFLNWGCSNLTHLPRRPKKLNIMIKVGSVLTPCMIGFRLRESIWAYMIYALNVILWRFCIVLLFSVKVSCLLCRYINYCFIQFTVEKFGLLDIVGALCLLAYMSSRQLRKCTKFHIRASH